MRQSGLLDFALADIYTDADTLQQANEAVGELLAKGIQNWSRKDILH